MGVKVVPFILFALAGECLSLTLHQKQVDDVLEKMYHKISEIDEKLSKIENRVTELENSQTKPKENKPTNLEDAMRTLGMHSYRSLDEGSPDSKNKTVKLCFNHTQLCNDEDLPDQCRTYNTLTDTNRLTARVSFENGTVFEEPRRHGCPMDVACEKMSDHSGDPNQSEEWQGEGWYRFKNGEPGIRMAAIHEQMATKADENCGANNGAYWNTEVQEIPNGFGENKDSRVKFGSDIKDMKVTNCGRFFVYFLPNAPPDYGYCFVRVTMKDFKENVEVYSD